MTSPSGKPNEELEKELEDIAKILPSKKIEVDEQVRFPEEAEMRLHDYRFYLSLVMVLGFLILLGIPLLRSQEDLLQVIASILAGPVGAVIGYYFGVRKREEV
ncbi:MAG: hypothetical protein HWN66_17970 [Candidatus Helarchaeota archaeon]|nr:hypothetical protein [Candidatus Helarchaeota archaeon]